jgi:N-dimethylarginine dimethylaminohydrolase
VLAELFPDAILASEADAVAFGLNACSDGTSVVMPATARRLAATFRERGFCPVPIETSELQKAGGSVKCCTLELGC